MVDSILKIITIVVMVVFVVVFIPAVAPYVTERLPYFGDTVGNLIGAIWDAFRNMVNRVGFQI